MYVIGEPDPTAQAQIAAPPQEALHHLAGVLELIELAPWAGGPQNPGKPGGNMRIMPFGERGLITYVVLEPQREIYIVRVQWI
ncbi:hypothetical protein GT755_07040 [Herbidospora sp. NEAU-GS84]|uniref:Uncharacterized protein n=1 Tax=Herbidospora solisilvae TaxID=2696284 RepID=A0A7C9JB27_9ACTN|nr:hypothetical protein [Herbidospora solisilvae]NAS21441.1 hypothetical protein [Herbidospora solisilvae]